MSSQPLITALIYTDSAAADLLLRQTAIVLMERGHTLAGLVQHNQPRPGRSRCDMILEELASGDLVPISQDRGPHARGCVLDVGQLLDAMEKARAAITAHPDAVILNKFGKIESEGGGFRSVIAEVVEARLPLLIAVPWRNIDSWRLFAGELSRDVVMTDSPLDAAALARLVVKRIGEAQSGATTKAVGIGASRPKRLASVGPARWLASPCRG
jgi:nucleoside-triphosphatase THEP1